MTGNICVVGLGKLGACIAACLADKGFSVMGVDIDPRTLESVNNGESPVREPGLGDLLARNRGRLRVTADYRLAIGRSDVTFVVVPTPSEDHGGFSLKYVIDAAREIGAALRNKSGYHLVVLTSTVLPGSTEHGVLPVLESASGKRCGSDFGLCYSPEFIALGSVIHDFLSPDLLLIGESDSRAGSQLADLYKRVCENDPPVARMNFVNAEVTKLSLNAYVTMKITFANMLAELCEQLPGGDVDAVTSALSLDSRIGPRYFRGSIGYGGPCFPRDNLALAYLARQLGDGWMLPEAIDRYNRGILDRVVQKILRQLPDGGRVAILGMSYKPDTDVVDESQGLQLADRLAAIGMPVVVYDRIALANARRILGNRVEYAASLGSAVNGVRLIVIANRDPEFQSLDFQYLANGRRPAVLDAWRLLRERAGNSGLDYTAIGLNDDRSQSPNVASLWSETARLRP